MTQKVEISERKFLNILNLGINTKKIVKKLKIKIT